MSGERKEILYQHESIVVWYWPTHGLIHHEMHGFCRGEPFRAALEAGLAALKKHKLSRWMSDDRSNNALPKNDEEWARTNWFPRTQQAGWQYWAIIKPEKILGEMHMRRYAETYAKHGVTARFFPDPDEGFEWITTIGRD